MQHQVHNGRAVPETSQQRLLLNAAGLMGHRELATRLHIAETLLDAWIRGHCAVPDRKLRELAKVLDTWAKR